MHFEQYLKFPGFLSKAVTLSYDDGRIEDVRLVETMRKYGLKGTLNLNSSRIYPEGNDFHPTLAQFKEFAKSGDIEIAVHGVKHLLLTKFPPTFITREILSDREALEKMFATTVRGMAYAYGVYNDEIAELLRLCGIVYARITAPSENFKLPSDWLKLAPTCKHMHPELFDLVDKFLAPEKSGAWNDGPSLFYLWGHSYEFTRDNNWDVIERFGEKMAERNDIWHATNIEVYNYVQAFKNLVFTLDMSYVENPSALDVYLNNGKTEVLAKAGEVTKFM